MSKLSKIFRIFSLLKISFLSYLVILNVSNGNSTPLLDKSLGPLRDQIGNLCLNIPPINTDNIFNNGVNFRKVYIEMPMSQDCDRLFSNILRIQNYNCAQKKCFYRNISNKYINDISNIFLQSIHSFFFHIKKIFYKFRDNNELDYKDEIKIMTHTIQELFHFFIDFTLRKS